MSIFRELFTSAGTSEVAPTGRRGRPAKYPPGRYPKAGVQVLPKSMQAKPMPKYLQKKRGPKPRAVIVALPGAPRRRYASAKTAAKALGVNQDAIYQAIRSGSAMHFTKATVAFAAPNNERKN